MSPPGRGKSRNLITAHPIRRRPKLLGIRGRRSTFSFCFGAQVDSFNLLETVYPRAWHFHIKNSVFHPSNLRDLRDIVTLTPNISNYQGSDDDDDGYSVHPSEWDMPPHERDVTEAGGFSHPPTSSPASRLSHRRASGPFLDSSEGKVAHYCG